MSHAPLSAGESLTLERPAAKPAREAAVGARVTGCSEASWAATHRVLTEDNDHVRGRQSLIDFENSLTRVRAEVVENTDVEATLEKILALMGPAINDPFIRQHFPTRVLNPMKMTHYLAVALQNHLREGVSESKILPSMPHLQEGMEMCALSILAYWEHVADQP